MVTLAAAVCGIVTMVFACIGFVGALFEWATGRPFTGIVCMAIAVAFTWLSVSAALAVIHMMA